MKTNKERLAISKLSLAVQAALLAMFVMPPLAFADDAEVAALTQPSNSVEIGVGNTSDSAAKFGEYNGLNKSGANLIGNFSVRGGDAYGAGSGISRWEFKGTDLGTTSRELRGSMSNQGQWNLGFGYDELRHNFTDTYQTPYQGSMGGNSFTLPGFGLAPNATTLTAAQKAAFQTVDIGTSRKNTSFNAGYEFSPRLGLKFDYNHLDQSGAKLMAFGSAAFGSTPAPSGEVVSILPNPTNYQTDTINLALNWTGDQGHLTGSYFGSFFREGYDRVTFQTFAGASNLQTMSTAPSNDFHQLNLSGGYSFSPKTKLAGGLSYGRNTQNDPFVVDSFMMVTPAQNTSLNGLVVTSHADLKLTDQTTKKLALSAGVKYDERDNRTASNIYNFQALGTGNIANYPNTPLSYKKTQLELAGDYRLDKDQRVRLAYNRENVNRWCSQYAVGGSNYPAGTNCVVATASTDDKLSAIYKLKASDTVDTNLGYSYSKRKTDSDQNAIAAYIGVRGGDVGSTVGTIKGLNAGDYIGFYPYFDASRTQQMLKAGVNWQAHDKLSLGLGGRYTDDKYDSTYGVQNGNTWSLNLDATYNYSEKSSVTAYMTQQSSRRDLTDLQRSLAQGAGAASATAIAIPAGATWTNKLQNDDITFGVGAKKGGLMGGKLELAGDLTYSLGKTGYGTQLNYATTTNVASGSLTCSDPRILSCGQLPDIKNEMLSLKITGIYQVDKASKIAVGYMFQKLISNDYFYNALQYGYSPNTLMPTNQQEPNYSVNVVTVSYIYNF